MPRRKPGHSCFWKEILRTEKLVLDGLLKLACFGFASADRILDTVAFDASARICRYVLKVIPDVAYLLLNLLAGFLSAVRSEPHRANRTQLTAERSADYQEANTFI